MRIGVISDVHGNAVALQEVMVSLESSAVDEVICLGDIVGYGPHPNICAHIVRENCSGVISGNHDRGLTDHPTASAFNDLARVALCWTRDRLRTDDLEWLRTLPSENRHRGGFLYCHGAPGAPDEYIITPRDATVTMLSSAESIVLCGHTHRPMACAIDEDGRCQALRWADGVELSLDSSRRYLINPGSVGQPRDGDARAAYAILDLDRRTASLHRVPYEVRATQAAMIQGGLPAELATRLASGN